MKEENTAVMSFTICIRHQITCLSGKSKDNEMTGQVPPTKIHAYKILIGKIKGNVSLVQTQRILLIHSRLV